MDTGTVAILIALFVQVLSGGFWAGRLSSRVTALDDRLRRMEKRLEYQVL